MQDQDDVRDSRLGGPVERSSTVSLARPKRTRPPSSILLALAPQPLRASARNAFHVTTFQPQ
jgi:hypothetical protein